MARVASEAIAGEASELPIVMGGMSPIDPLFVLNMRSKGALDTFDAVAVHGFPLDWNHWQIHDWPAKLDEIRAVTSRSGSAKSVFRVSARKRFRSLG
jgi:beta-xylosidase